MLNEFPTSGDLYGRCIKLNGTSCPLPVFCCPGFASDPTPAYCLVQVLGAVVINETHFDNNCAVCF